MPNGVLQPFKPVAVPAQREHWLQERVAAGSAQEEAQRSWERFAACDFYANDLYLVQLDRTPPHEFKTADVWMLYIKRHDNDHVRDWRDLQAIKNIIVGREVEAIELYPAESRLCDASNRTALFCFMQLNGVQSPRFPVGFNVRIVSNEPLNASESQRPFFVQEVTP